MSKFNKKDITVDAIKLVFPTAITTKTGVVKGQPGDYLVTADRDEQFIVPKQIFEMSYQQSNDPDTLAPLEVDNLLLGETTHNAAYITFTTPYDVDYSAYNLFVDGVLRETNTLKGDIATSLLDLTPDTQYTILITTLDTAGNESTGKTLIFKTLVAPIV